MTQFAEIRRRDSHADERLENPIETVFLSHPRAVGESYVEHMRAATGFGTKMMLAGAACFIHGLVPALFKKTGSRTVVTLNDKLCRRTQTVRGDGECV